MLLQACLSIICVHRQMVNSSRLAYVLPYCSQSTNISYPLVDINCKPKPYAANCCKLPRIEIIITKKLREFKASLILPPFAFAGRLPNVRRRLVCYCDYRRRNQASIITLPEAKCARGLRQQALMGGTMGR